MYICYNIIQGGGYMFNILKYRSKEARHYGIIFSFRNTTYVLEIKFGKISWIIGF